MITKVPSITIHPVNHQVLYFLKNTKFIHDSYWIYLAIGNDESEWTLKAKVETKLYAYIKLTKKVRLYEDITIHFQSIENKRYLVLKSSSIYPKNALDSFLECHNMLAADINLDPFNIYYKRRMNYWKEIYYSGIDDISMFVMSKLSELNQNEKKYMNNIHHSLPIEKEYMFVLSSKEGFDVSPYKAVLEQPINIDGFQIEGVSVSQEKMKSGNGTKLVMTYNLSSNLSMKDSTAFTLLNALLGGCSHSRLVNSIRRKANLAYYSFSIIDVSTRSLLIFTECEKEKMDTIKELIKKEINSLQSGCISDKEFQATKKFLLADILYVQDHADSIINEFLNDMHTFGKDMRLEKSEMLSTFSKDELVDYSNMLVLRSVQVL